MKQAHEVLGIAVLATNGAAAAWGVTAWLRGIPSTVFWYLLRVAQLVVVIEVIVGLVLSATGIYGVVAYRTHLRTHEIGIRVALGASRGDVLRLVLTQGVQLTIIGLIVGLCLALGLTRFIAGMLYGVSPTDPVTVAEVAGLLAAISVLACYLPAHRAMSINPVSAIREQ